MYALCILGVLLIILALSIWLQTMKAFIGLLMCGALGAFTACNIQQLVYMSNSNSLQRNNRQTDTQSMYIIYRFSSDPPVKNGHVRFTTVPLEPSSKEKWLKFSFTRSWQFLTLDSLYKSTCGFMQQRQRSKLSEFDTF